MKLYTVTQWISDNTFICPKCHETWLFECGTCLLNALSESLRRHVKKNSHHKIHKY